MLFGLWRQPGDEELEALSSDENINNVGPIEGPTADNSNGTKSDSVAVGSPMEEDSINYRYQNIPISHMQQKNIIIETLEDFNLLRLEEPLVRVGAEHLEGGLTLKPEVQDDDVLEDQQVIVNDETYPTDANLAEPQVTVSRRKKKPPDVNTQSNNIRTTTSESEKSELDLKRYQYLVDTLTTSGTLSWLEIEEILSRFET